MMESKDFLEVVKNQGFVIRYKELSNIINNNIITFLLPQENKVIYNKIIDNKNNII